MAAAHCSLALVPHNHTCAKSSLIFWRVKSVLTERPRRRNGRSALPHGCLWWVPPPVFNFLVHMWYTCFVCSPRNDPVPELDIVVGILGLTMVFTGSLRAMNPGNVTALSLYLAPSWVLSYLHSPSLAYIHHLQCYNILPNSCILHDRILQDGLSWSMVMVQWSLISEAFDQPTSFFLIERSSAKSRRYINKLTPVIIDIYVNLKVSCCTSKTYAHFD